MIVIVHGPDAALCRAAVADAARRHDPDGQSTTRLDGRTATLGEIVSQVSSPGFFGAGRVVIVDGLLSRIGRGRGEQEDEGSEATGGIDVVRLFAATAAENALILVDSAVSGVPAAVKKALPPDATVIAGEPPRGADLVAWLRRRAELAGASLDAATARILAERIYPFTWSSKPSNPRFDLPPDLDRLGNEIEKLAVAANGGAISRSLVERLVAAGDQDQVFRFIDALAQGRLAAAIEELGKLVAAGEEPFAIVAQLQQQAELGMVIEAAGAGRDAAAIGREIGLSNPGRLSAIAASRRGRPEGSGWAALLDALDADRQVKRGELRDPLDPVYSLVARGARRGGAESRRGGL